MDDSHAWTKTGALRRLRANELLCSALAAEVGLRPIVLEAVLAWPETDVKRARLYVDLKRKAWPFIGGGARQPALRSAACFDAFVFAIDDLLPSEADWRSFLEASTIRGMVDGELRDLLGLEPVGSRRVGHSQ